ncbi:hypothetical protein AAHR10_12440, partial [Listeria monocytogenes]
IPEPIQTPTRFALESSITKEKLFVPFSRTWVFPHYDIECRQEVLYNCNNENISVFIKGAG